MIFDLIPRLFKHKTAMFYSTSLMAVTFSNIVSNIIIMRWILPEELGLWNSFRIIQPYAAILLAGIINGLSRELPFTLGAGKALEGNKIAGTALTCVFSSCVVILVIGLFATMFFSRHGSDIVLSIVGISIIIALSFYQSYLTVTFRSKKSFDKLTIVQIIEIVIVFSTLPLVYYYHYQGMVIRYIIIACLTLLTLHFARPLKIRPIWNKRHFKLIFKTGTPIFVLDYIRSNASTFDRLVLLRFGGVREVGFYALATTVFRAFQTFRKSISNYVYPKMSYKFGESNDPKQLWPLALKSSLFVMAINVPLAILGFIFLPIAVTKYFPNYVAGIPSAQIMFLTAIVSGGEIGANALFSMKSWKWMTSYQLLFAAVLIVCPIICVVSIHPPFTGVAFGMLFAHISSLVFGLWFTYKATHSKNVSP